MKRLALLIALIIPTIARAQRADLELEKLERYQAAWELERPDYRSPATLRYRWGYVLAQPAGLYCSLAAASQGQPAFKLRAGDEVFLVQENSRWLRVARHTYQKPDGPSPGTDTTVYYLRAAAVRNKAGSVTIFSLH